MTDEVEAASLYANLEPVKRANYDEITINFGKPVIQPDHADDLFSNVTFTSPISAVVTAESDLPGDRCGRGSNPGVVPPIPAPRLSKQKNLSPSTCDILDQGTYLFYRVLRNGLADFGSVECQQKLSMGLET